MDKKSKEELRKPIGPFGLIAACIVVVLFITVGGRKIVNDRQTFQKIPAWQASLLLDLQLFSEKVKRVSCDVETSTVIVELGVDAPWFVKNQMAIASAKSALGFFHDRITTVKLLVGTNVVYSIRYHDSGGILSESTNGSFLSP